MILSSKSGIQGKVVLPLDHWEESLLATRKVEGGGKAVKPGIVFLRICELSSCQWKLFYDDIESKICQSSLKS